MFHEGHFLFFAGFWALDEGDETRGSRTRLVDGREGGGGGAPMSFPLLICFARVWGDGTSLGVDGLGRNGLVCCFFSSFFFSSFSASSTLRISVSVRSGILGSILPIISLTLEYSNPQI